MYYTTINKNTTTIPLEQKVESNLITWRDLYDLANTKLMEVPLTPEQLKIEKTGGNVNRTYIDYGRNARLFLLLCDLPI